MLKIENFSWTATQYRNKGIKKRATVWRIYAHHQKA